jgi:hypothetical protein
VKISDQLSGAIQERQKETPAGWGAADDERPTRRGAFKVSSKALKYFKKASANIDEPVTKPSEMLFKRSRDYINKIPRDKLPEFFGEKNMPDTQDLMARHPKKAFERWLRRVGKVDPRIAKYVRAVPENVPLIYYMFMEIVSGQLMADIIFKRHFETESGHIGQHQAAASRKKRAAAKLKAKHSKFQAAGI